MTTTTTTSAGLSASRVRRQRQKTFRAVFPIDVPQPSPLLPHLSPGEPFGGGGGGPHASSLRTNRSSTTITRSVTASASSSFTLTAAPASASASTPPGRPAAGSARRHTSSSQQSQSIPTSSSSAVAGTAAASDQLRWDRAWHVVTSRIQLPTSVAVEDSFGTLAPESQDLHLDAAFYEALPIVLHPAAALPLAARTNDVFSWHGLQVRQHFLHHVLPLLAACTSQRGDSEILSGVVETLEAAHRQYFYGLHLLARGFHDDSAGEAAVAKFQRDLHALVSNSWTPSLMQALRAVLQRTLHSILASPGPSADEGFEPSADEGPDAASSRDELFRLLDSLQKVGLAGEKFQVLFAEMMDTCMQDIIKETYSGVWERPRSRESLRPGTGPMCMDHLRNWVENCYGRLAVEVLGRLGGQVAWSDVERWREIAIGRLATLRMQELFDIVLCWPQSLGGLDDLGFAVTTPQRRLQLTDIFSATLQKRLLHPGRSTLDILQTYISMIRTFHALDHSKVLLDRVVPALKICLWMRDDAIRIVVTGLLANHNAANPDDNRGKLVELAVILNEASQQQRRHADDEDLDWNDMTWVPDPVDAAVNYKRPKNEDIIGTLIGALGLQDVFIKEFQSIMAERLLSKQPDFQQEIKVLGLLKRRFGEAALQNCDVMTKDIMDSKGVDSTLLKSIHEAGGGDDDDKAPTYHAKILSRLFWPNLSSEPFTIPEPVAKLQRRYEAGFERLKTSRKLTWLDHLGSATVKLDFEDGSVEVECKTYEAAVIYEFSDDDDDDTATGPRQRHFNDLWEKLRIDEDLLESALRFWTSKRVLRDVGDRTYVVRQRLHEEDAPAEAGTSGGGGQTQPPPPSSPKKAKADTSKEKERRTIYWQFIKGMLTNSSPAMPLAQIAMMMKMLMADGCPWGPGELRGFLEEKVVEGELEFVGGKYRLKK